MKTKFILLLGVLAAACSLTSCDIYGYPGYGYSSFGGYGAPLYSSGIYSSPLLSYNSFYSRPFYGGYSGFYPRSSVSYGRGYCPPVRTVPSYSCAPLITHAHHSFNSPSFHHAGFGGFSGSSGSHCGIGGGGFSLGAHHHR